MQAVTATTIITTAYNYYYYYSDIVFHLAIFSIFICFAIVAAAMMVAMLPNTFSLFFCNTLQYTINTMPTQQHEYAGTATDSLLSSFNWAIFIKIATDEMKKNVNGKIYSNVRKCSTLNRIECRVACV